MSIATIADGELGSSVRTKLNSAIASINGLTLFEHHADAGNTGSTETDLFSDTLVAGQLASDGDRLEATYGVYVPLGNSSIDIKLYFGGTQVLDSGGFSVSGAASYVRVNVELVRVSSSTVRFVAIFTRDGASSVVAVGEVTGLTLSNTQIIKTTGTASGSSAADNDIVGKLSRVSYFVAP